METYTAERKYHGYIIKTCTQDSGRKTFDVYEADGVTDVEWACESLAIAKAGVDAEIERLERAAANWELRMAQRKNGVSA